MSESQKCQVSNVKCLHCSLRHAEKLLLLKSDICQVSSIKFQIHVDPGPWDMLNNFCFHVYAQKSHMTSRKNYKHIVAFSGWTLLLHGKAVE